MSTPMSDPFQLLLHLQSQLSQPSRLSQQHILQQLTDVINLMRKKQQIPLLRTQSSPECYVPASCASPATSIDDTDVREWIESSYDINNNNINITSTTILTPNQPHVAGIQTTMLCMRFIKKIRQKIYKRILNSSGFHQISALQLSSPVQSVLCRSDDWSEFDVFLLHSHCGPLTLCCLALHVLERFNLFEKFQISAAHFANFFQKIESGYKAVPYHNNIHAADVLHNTVYFLSQASQQRVLSPLDLFAAIIASSIHDYAHPGTNNQFQIATESLTALRYNDRSVLENMHCSEAFLVMKQRDCDVLSGCSPSDRKELRKSIIDMVLSTDMTQHFTHVNELTHMINQQPIEQWSRNNAKQRNMLLETAIHSADLGNPTKPLKLYLKHTANVIEEFYQQGDAEQRLGLAISPMMDRSKPNVERSQIGFIDAIVSPLFNLYQQLCPEIRSSCLVQLATNRQHFQEEVNKLASKRSSLTGNMEVKKQ